MEQTDGFWLIVYVSYEAPFGKNKAVNNLTSIFFWTPLCLIFKIQKSNFPGLSLQEEHFMHLPLFLRLAVWEK
jgi:hypothetical protein